MNTAGGGASDNDDIKTNAEGSVASNMIGKESSIENRHPIYVDYSNVSIEELNLPQGRSNTFPVILHQMLSFVDRNPINHVIEDVGVVNPSSMVRWDHHGRSFTILDKNMMVNFLFPMFFPYQTEFQSLQRQLNLYGFMRLTKHLFIADDERKPPSTTTKAKQNSPSPRYYHSMFLRTRPELCSYMSRSRKSTKSNIRTMHHHFLDPTSEPKFDEFLPLLFEHDVTNNDDKKIQSYSSPPNVAKYQDEQLHQSLPFSSNPGLMQSTQEAAETSPLGHPSNQPLEMYKEGESTETDWEQTLHENLYQRLQTVLLSRGNVLNPEDQYQSQTYFHQTSSLPMNSFEHSELPESRSSTEQDIYQLRRIEAKGYGTDRSMSDLEFDRKISETFTDSNKSDSHDPYRTKETHLLEMDHELDGPVKKRPKQLDLTKIEKPGMISTQFSAINMPSLQIHQNDSSRGLYRHYLANDNVDTAAFRSSSSSSEAKTTDMWLQTLQQQQEPPPSPFRSPHLLLYPNELVPFHPPGEPGATSVGTNVARKGSEESQPSGSSASNDSGFTSFLDDVSL